MSTKGVVTHLGVIPQRCAEGKGDSQRSFTTSLNYIFLRESLLLSAHLCGITLYTGTTVVFLISAMTKKLLMCSAPGITDSCSW